MRVCVCYSLSISMPDLPFLQLSDMLSSMQDPILEELWRVRQEYAQRFRYEAKAIADDLRKQEQQHPERLISFSARPARKKRIM